MSNVIATDAQAQEVPSGLVDLFEITLPNGSTLYFHPGLDADLTDVRFRDKTPPTNPVLAGNFIVGDSYTIKTTGPSGSSTHYPSIGAANNNVGTIFTATGAGSGLGLATANDCTIRDYDPLPMMIDGLDISSDGASNRPSLTIANVGNLLSSQLEGFKNDDLVGQRLVRRQTLEKYLHGNSGDASPPIEFRTQEYIIDRIAAEDGLTVSFEVATPFDLENVKIPRRIVVGKFCSWKYQGHDSGKGGGCTWKANSSYSYKGTDGTVYSHTAYFDFDDRPLVLLSTLASITSYSSSTAYTEANYTYNLIDSAVSTGSFVPGKTYVITSPGNTVWAGIGALANSAGTIFTAISSGTNGQTGTATEIEIYLCILASTGNTPSITSAYWKQAYIWTEYSSSVSYGKNAYVRFSGTVWKSLHSGNSDNTPEPGGHWERADICGKLLNSCKIRYGVIPVVRNSANQNPMGKTNGAARLPFGSFPGTLKY